jgi:hypothetical protein
MELPGKLTERHIQAAKDRGDKEFIYKHQIIDVEKIHKLIKKGKKNAGPGRGYSRLSTESKENQESGKSDIDSSPGNSTE